MDESEVRPGSDPAGGRPEPLGYTVERAMDAAANRAREGLRVVEDFARFVAPDEFVARRARELRHLVTSLVARVAHPDSLLAERDVEHDAGASPDSFAPRERTGAEDVLRSAFKRSEEALRSLAEFSRLVEPAVADSLERARYELYSLERRALVPLSAVRRVERVRLMVAVEGARAADALRAALAAGADCVLCGGTPATPGASDREFLALAREAKAIATEAGALLLVACRPDIARLAIADGVVLAADGMAVTDAKRIAGEAAIVCRESRTLDEALASEREGASAVVLLPSEGARSANEGLVKAASAALARPVFAWCGDARDAAALVGSGATRIATRVAGGTAEDMRTVRDLLAGRKGSSDPRRADTSERRKGC